MNIGNTPVWQVAAGDTNHNYADVCLDWDVILNGPGSEGPCPACAEVLRTAWGLSSRKTTDLQRFAEDIAEGDYVVLRMGTTDVLGFGVIVGHYEWNDAFGDVDGWDLQHVRRVKWLWKYKGTAETFPAYTMKLGDTVQRLDATRRRLDRQPFHRAAGDRTTLGTASPEMANYGIGDGVSRLT
jgi:hypothetical protein